MIFRALGIGFLAILGAGFFGQNLAGAATNPASAAPAAAGATETILDPTVAPEPFGLLGHGEEFWTRNLDIFSFSRPGDDFHQTVSRFINFAVIVVSAVAIAVLAYIGFLAIFGSATEDNHKKVTATVKYVVMGIVILFASYTFIFWTFKVVQIGGWRGIGSDGRIPHDPNESCIPIGSIGDWFCEVRHGSDWTCAGDWQCHPNYELASIQPAPERFDIERLACDATNSVNGVFGDSLCQSTIIRPTKAGPDQFCSKVATARGGAFTCQNLPCQTDADCTGLNDTNSTIHTIVPGQSWACDTAAGVCASDSGNRIPTANFIIRDAAGDPLNSGQTVPIGERLYFDGQGSYDPDGDAITFTWEKTSGPDFNFPTVTTGFFDLPLGIPTPGEYVFQMTVRDSVGQESTKTVSLRAVNLAQTGLPIELRDAAGTVLDPQDPVIAGRGFVLDPRGSFTAEELAAGVNFGWAQERGPAIAPTAVTIADDGTASTTGLASGVYRFKVTATDSIGNTHTGTIDLTIVDPHQPPVADFVAQPGRGAAPLSVSFFDQTTEVDGDPLTYRWDFGDGSVTASDKNPVHVFTTPGSYTVTLEVQDVDGIDRVVAPISVEPAAGPALTIDPASIQIAPFFTNFVPEAARRIYFTTDGSEPAVDPADRWTGGEIPIDRATTIRAIAVDAAGAVSAETRGTYAIKAGRPTAVPAGGTFPAGSVDVTLAPASPGDRIFYTLNDTAPTTADAEATGPITIDRDLVLRARAWNAVAAEFLNPSDELRLLFTTSGAADARPIVTITGGSGGPLANGGTVTGGDSVTMRADVTDPDGDPVELFWEQIAGTDVGVTGMTTSLASFAAPATTQTLKFRLTATDSPYGASASAEFTVEVRENEPPVIDIIGGSNGTITDGGTVTAGDGVTLQASVSDPEGEAVTIAWSQTAGADVGITGQNADTVSFTTPGAAAQTIRLRLTATDASGHAATKDFSIQVVQSSGGPAGPATPGVAPMVNAGPDQNVVSGDTVQLGGIAQSTTAFAVDSFHWEQIGTPAVTFSPNADAQSPSFVAPIVQSQTVLQFQFSATTTDGGVGTDNLVVVVSNAPPTADAGPDRTVAHGSVVSITGSATDRENNPLTLAWEQTGGPAVSLGGAAAATVSFVAPEVTADTVVTLRLRASDGSAEGSDEVAITVTPNDLAVNAGINRDVRPGEAVALGGSATTPSGSTPGFLWTQISGPTVAITDADTLTPSFTAPEVVADEVIRLRLTGTLGGFTASDEVEITVKNAAPRASAGPGQTVTPGAAVTLDGSATTEPDGEPMAVLWTQTSGPAVALADADTLAPSFTAPGTASPVTLSFQIAATDPHGAIGRATVSIRIQNSAPVADAGPDRIESLGTTVTLDGSGSSDPDGDPLAFFWTQTAGPAVALSSQTAAAPTFTAPSAAAELSFRLQVGDGTVESSDTVTIHIANRIPTVTLAASVGGTAVADGGTIPAGSTVTLDASGSADPEGGALSFSWDQTAGASVGLAGSTVAAPTFTAPATAQWLRFNVIATDPDGAASSETISLLVQ